jgi:serine/threonine-protein kinase
MGPEMVQDRETGLFWQRGGAPGPLSHWESPAYIEELNRQTWGGRNDWRLPALPELLSLLTREKSTQGLYLDPVFDSRLPFCWSATESVAGGAYGVLFYPGSIQAQNREMRAFVRAVAGKGKGVPEFQPAPELLARGRELLLSHGRRRLPRRAEVEGFLRDGGFFSEVALADGLQLYFLPTEEFITALIRLFRHLGVKRVVEVGAGEGFVAGALAARGFPVAATDLEAVPGTPYGVPVHRASHLEAVALFKPELAFWCWPPFNSRAPGELIQAPGLKYYLDVGDGGFAAGAPGLAARFGGRYLHGLSRLGYTRLDWGPFRHNRCFLFRQS